MSVSLEKYVEKERAYVGARDYLAVGYVEEDRDADFPWKAVRAGGHESWHSSYAEAWQEVAKGLVPPSTVYTLP